VQKKGIYLRGTEEETLAKFREVRDAIEKRIREWLHSLRSTAE
jgi:hypothetical protein